MSRFTFADIFTVLNGLFGLLAIYYLDYDLSVFFLLFAVLCDGLDGFVARKNREKERQGIVMDSLADSVSFVLMPALCLFSLQSHGWLAFLYSLSAFVYIWCGFYRLSKFTTYDSDLNFFSGLPTPEAALLLVLLIKIIEADTLAIPFSILLSLLMVSNVKYPKIRDKLSYIAGAIILISIGLFFVWSSFLYTLFFFLLIYLALPIIFRSDL
ncbi:MAG: CDP-diacylglycerol--serine O-phosphatidyltransferase [Candidatus Thermoplasmatota archaeon]|nr:CDP-diacylglycerol--serine O-phosphatidyltransferase [Candidatus Thermoplasmatota archaeon]